MEALNVGQRSLFGNATVAVNQLCNSLDNVLVLRRNKVIVASSDGIASGSNRDKGSQKKLVSKCRTASTISEKNSFSSGQKDTIVKWRLDEELERTRDLQMKLKVCRTLREKIDVVESQAAVRAVFTANVPDGAVRLAMRELSEYELYLLKCLVAIEQGHLLGLNEEEEVQELFKGCNGLDGLNGSSASGKNIVKETLQLMSRLIDSFEDARGISNFDVAQALRQKKRTYADIQRSKVLESLKSFIAVLDSVERFYDCIGGIVGYQLAGLELIRASETGELRYPERQNARETYFHVPEGKDLSKDATFATRAAGWGVARLAELGEIYPLGGAGDRLGLMDDATGECLPVAMLPYCGRTLLEGLVRDLQAREFLHYRVYGSRIITPVAIMTSAAKQNNKRVQRLLESHQWFGRGKDNFRLFEQPLIPTLAAEDGHWLARGSFEPVLKPGGHGVLWKLAKDSGVFEWFYKRGRKAAVIRQISNPVAATDVTLLALAGVGLQHKKKFGFASCERKVGAAEGVNILMEKKRADGSWEYGITCIEYTEFSRLGIADVPVSTGSMRAKFPANTNVLFVDLESVQEVAGRGDSASLPGMILNLKKPITYTDHRGEDRSVRAGRIECTMQNVADSLQNKYSSQLACIDHERLDTYILYNQRRKVASSAKRRRKAGEQNLHQTPDGSFLDVTRNAYDLLTSCGVAMDEMDQNYCYIETGPPYIVLLHPALGPLWDIVRQKIHGGSISKGSEVQLEIAEFLWKDVDVEGSLLVKAENVMGAKEDEVLVYGVGFAKCRLERVKVLNRGVDWNCSTNVYWQNKVSRQECLKVILRGQSEFDASDVVFEGTHVFEVPDGHRMLIRPSETGFRCTLERLSATNPSWGWLYKMEDNGAVKLSMIEGGTVC